MRVPSSPVDVCLQRCLNQIVVDANFDGQEVPTLALKSDLIVRVIPALDGLESYVLHTSQKVVPVIAA